jgi:hypothetical protein
LCKEVENAIHILLKRPETERWRYQFLSADWLKINHLHSLLNYFLNKIFSGYQPCPLVKRQKHQCFKDHLCPRVQGTDVSVVRVTLRLTVSQSVSQSWCRDPSGTHDEILVLYKDYYSLCILGAPSLTRGWVCHLSEVSVFVVFSCCTGIFTTVMYLENQSVSNIGLPQFHIHDDALANGSCWLVLRLCYVRPAS